MSVSVIIPFYNANKYLSRAIESCLTQETVSQIIIIDDGSTDASTKIANNYAKKHSKIKLLNHDQNEGRSAARNTGLPSVQSDYFAFLDADDYYESDRFTEALRLLKGNEHLDGIYELVKTIFEYPALDNGSYPEITGIREIIPTDKLFEYLILGEKNHFSLIGCTFRTSSIINNFHFDTDLKIGEDTDFIWQVTRDRILISGGDIPKTYRTIHGHNSYFNKREVIKNKVILYNKWLQKPKHQKVHSKIVKKLLKSYGHYSSLQNQRNGYYQIFKLQKIISQLIMNPSLLTRLF